MGILAAASFVVQSTYHSTELKNPGQMVFDREMILPINNVADWRYIRHNKKAQTDKDVIHENTTIIDHGYRLGDKFMTKNK